MTVQTAFIIVLISIVLSIVCVFFAVLFKLICCNECHKSTNTKLVNERKTHTQSNTTRFIDQLSADYIYSEISKNNQEALDINQTAIICDETQRSKNESKNFKLIKTNFDGYYISIFKPNSRLSNAPGKQLDRRKKSELSNGEQTNINDELEKLSFKKSFRLRSWFKRKKSLSNGQNGVSATNGENEHFIVASNRRLSVITEE